MTEQVKGRGTVLVVDDEPEIREIIAISATHLGYDVLEAGDGRQAMEVVRAHAVDVIVSDLMMPRVSGLSLLNDLRDAGCMQPFIIITAYPSQDSTLQALRLGAFDYLEKPFEQADLIVLLRDAMRLSIGLSARTSTKNETGVASEIQRLKTLRYTEETPTSKPEPAAREKMLGLFIAEAMPQLLFCDASIKGLMQQEERAFELGYLFRVMQALAAAAQSMGAKEFAGLATAAEMFYTTLRVRPRVVVPELVELAQRTNATLQTALGELDHGEVQSHRDLIAELTRATTALEGRDINKAG